MHDPHPTNGPHDPQPADPAATTPIVGSFDVSTHHLADGRAALALSWPAPAGATALACQAGALRRALDAGSTIGYGGTAEVVLLHPSGAALPSLLAAATGCTADQPVLATRLPVTDAIKRVEGRVLAGTVDRTTLAWAVPPAVLHVPSLMRALPERDESVLRPLTAPGVPIAWLDDVAGPA